jgi:hypothetical protein
MAGAMLALLGGKAKPTPKHATKSSKREQKPAKLKMLFF